MRVLADALEAAGHAEAQAALGAAIQARAADWPALALLLPALGAAESPTPATEQTLQALAFGTHDKNVTATARLALGNVARSLGDESPARAAKIVARFLQELADPASADSRWQLLLALGNAGSIEALPTLTRYLDDPAPDLRGAAAWAMRWIDSSQVDLLLTSKVLSGDRDRVVRLEAVRALRFRAKTVANFEAQKKALAKEVEPDVRVELLSNLWDARSSNPQAQRLVEKAAADDPAPTVREAAAKLLETAQAMP
jgi:HEAT repeat protein